jgi:hypothetical protein
MKKFLLLMISGIITLASIAQTLTLTFNGTNRNRNYQVVIDGASYYSNTATDPTNTNASVKKDITLSNQSVGSHTIEVYRVRNNNANNTGTTSNINGNAIYTNTFQLRQGYDMNVAISGNGQVTFSEKRVRTRGNNRGYGQQSIAPMTDESFNQLAQTVRNKWGQAGKITLEQSAFNNSANYFTTAQVRQLLLLVTSENNRLSLAKLAYPRVVDAANFTQLYDVFNTVASRDNMNAFIRNNPNNNGNWTGNNTTNNTNNTYRTPMADYQFSQLLQSANNQYNQSDRLYTIRNAVNNSNNYFTTAQVRQLLSIITSESDRLATAKLSYLRVTDPANFTSLYDLLYSQASRNELNNYVVQNGGSTNYNNTQYTNKTPMADDQFTQLVQKANNHFLPWDKVRDVRDAFNNTSYNFTTAQIRQLLTIASAEKDRFELAKLSWSRVTDPANFTQLYDVFNTQSYRDDLNAYMQSHPL